MKATTERQETKCIAETNTYFNYSINVKLPHEDQNYNLNGRLTYMSCQFTTFNKTSQYQSFLVQNKSSLKAWFNFS